MPACGDCDGNEAGCVYDCANGGLSIGSKVVEGLFIQIRSTGCPWADVGPLTHALSDLYAAYKAGLWLEDGAWLDQPSWYTDAMRMYESETNRQESQRMKEQSNAR